MFIDNLPNDEMNIKLMLNQVKRHIATLEQQFFDEENSDLEEEDKSQPEPS